MYRLFTLTKDHITLLSSMYVNWNGNAYQGAPEIDIKRPYGNKGSYEMVAKLLGWPIQSDGTLTDEITKRAIMMHEETATALQIVLVTKSFVPGKYGTTKEYDALSWQLIEATVPVPERSYSYDITGAHLFDIE